MSNTLLRPGERRSDPQKGEEEPRNTSCLRNAIRHMSRLPLSKMRRSHFYSDGPQDGFSRNKVAAHVCWRGNELLVDLRDVCVAELLHIHKFIVHQSSLFPRGGSVWPRGACQVQHRGESDAPSCVLFFWVLTRGINNKFFFPPFSSKLQVQCGHQELQPFETCKPP